VTHVQLGAVRVPGVPEDAAAAAIPPRDGFADPPGLAVRADLLTRVGGLEPVRGGALADLAARLEAAGHAVEWRADLPAPPRRATPGALLREGAARLWLFRRHPERHPLPRPRDAGWRLPLLALGALRANATPGGDPR
jgi:hypothetical protein